MDVLNLIKAWCNVTCKENSRYRNYDECFQECLEKSIRLVEENIKRYGLTDLSINYDKEDYEEEYDEYEEEEYHEDRGTWSEYDLISPNMTDFSTTGLYLRVNALLRKYGFSTYSHGFSTVFNSEFYEEVREELHKLSTQGTLEDAVRTVLRRRGLLSTM